MQITRVFDFLYYQAEKYPKNDALNGKENGQWKSYSTRDVIDIVNRLSIGLLKLGVSKNDRIALIAANRPEWNFLDLAIQQIGAVSVPMYPTITVEDYRYIFNDANVKIIFTGSKDLYEKAIAATRGMNVERIYSFDRVADVPHWTEVESLGRGEDVRQLDVHKQAVQPGDLLTLIYTSGTTGRPKGVMLSHQNIVSNAIGVSPNMPLPPGQSRALSFLPLCHIYERTGFYVFTYLGVSIYYAESMDTIAANLQEIKPHTFNTVPRLLEKVYDRIVAKGAELTGIKRSLFFWALNLGLKHAPNEKQGWWYDRQLALANKIIFSKWREALGGNIQFISAGAAALQPRLARVFWAAGIKVCEGYGLTETSPVITASIPTHEGIRIGYVGKPLPGVQVKIAADGEILCKGPNVMMGYYNQPEMTAEVLKEGWFHTGDVGELTPQGYLRITDRKKEMFKTSGGKYVAPQPMENKFKESLLIEQIMVLGENQKFPAALIVPSFDNLREWCKQHDIAYTSDELMVKNEKVVAKFQSEIDKYNENFGHWEQVKKIVVLPKVWGIDTGELTPTLKLKRKAICTKYAQLIDEIYR